MVESQNYQKVLSGRRISLSDTMCKKYNINEGDIVIVEEENGVLKVSPAQVIKRNS